MSRQCVPSFSRPLTPAMAAKKVFIIGDADRMVPQEEAEFAANAFLKLLEEPSAKTTLILTSSEPGALLPTIRSRSVGVRVPPLTASAMRAFLADPIVSSALDESGAPRSATERLSLAGVRPANCSVMSPGAVNCGRAKAHGCGAWTERIGAACCGDVCRGSGARGSFTDTLDAMLVLIGERMRASLHDADEARALGASRAADAVTLARERASGNVNPQLITARLLRELARSLS